MSKDTTEIPDPPDSRPTPTPTPPSPAAPRTAVHLLFHADVTAGMEGALAIRAVPRQDWDDLMQEARRRAWACGNPPTDVPACKALCQKIIGDLAVNKFVQNDRRALYNVGATGEPDNHVDESTDGERRDPIDQRTLLHLFDTMVTDGDVPPRSRQIVQLVAEGVPQDEIAGVLGVSHQTVRNDYTRIKKKYRERLRVFLESSTLHKVLGGTGTLVVVLALGWLLWQRHEPEASIRPDVIPPSPSATAHRSADQERADVQRGEAMHDCRDGDWDMCLMHLDEARQLDPAGDTTPEVQTIRAMATDAIQKLKDDDEGKLPSGGKPKK
jgi:DNA-directed RNA polymerase specialized sigma24 family protein